MNIYSIAEGFHLLNFPVPLDESYGYGNKREFINLLFFLFSPTTVQFNATINLLTSILIYTVATISEKKE